MATSPLISVIIPVYNGADFLAEAVASVWAQAYVPLEIVIVDDGSTDGTVQVVQQLGADIHYVYQPNQGPAAARNHGVALAQGELIAFLDADDLWPRHKLDRQVADLASSAEIQVAWGATQILPYDKTDDAFPDLAIRLYPVVGSILCRKAVFQTLGLFEPTLRYGEDVDWFIRLREAKIPVRESAELALIYRVRRGSMTYGKPLQELGLFQNIRRSLLRRHAASEQF